MHFEASWHASGLRWIGSLFNDAANFLDRAAARATATDSQAPRCADDHIDDMRARIYLRGLY